MKRDYWPWVLIGIGLVLRLGGLGDASLWYDEAGSAWMAALPFERMVAATAGDVHPPAYLALLWAWSRMFGDSTLSLRLPSALMGVVALGLAYYVMRNVLKVSRPVQLVGLAMLATAPFQIYFGQEARMYTMLEAVVLGAFVASKHRRWFIYSALVALMAYTHNYGLFYAAALAAGALIETPRLWRPIVGANVLAGLAYMPWAWVLLQQMATVGDTYWIQSISPGAVFYAVHQTLWGFSTPTALVAVAMLLTSGGLTLGTIKAVKAKLPISVFLLAFGPVGLASLVSVVWEPVLLFRGLAGSTPFVYLLIAHIFDRVELRHMAVGLAMLFAPLLASTATHYAVNGANKFNAAPVIQQMTAVSSGRVALYHVNEGGLLVLNRQIPADWDNYIMPSDVCELRNLGALSDGARSALGIVEADIADLVSDYDTVLVLWVHAPTSPQCEYDFGAALAARSQLVMDVYEGRPDDGLTSAAVYLYQPVEVNDDD